MTVRAERQLPVSCAAAWSFVEELDRWAPLVQGYVSHEKVDDRVSLWTLRGDLGPFSKEVHCRVTITEWVAPTTIVFSLEGLDEVVHGEGRITLHEDRATVSPPPPPPWWRRLLDWLTGRKTPLLPPPVEGGGMVTFDFSVHTDGPMAPMIDVLLLPWSQQVADRLLDDVLLRLAPGPATLHR